MAKTRHIICTMFHFLQLILVLFCLLTTALTYGQNQSIKSMLIYGSAADGYYITLHFGTPPQKVNVLVDTGSSNLAVAANNDNVLPTFFRINESESFHSLNKSIQVDYTDGSWEGILGTDLISLPSTSTVRSNFACIMSSRNFFSNNSKWQGILGLAFNEIAKPDASFSAFFDVLVKNLNVSNIFSMSLCGVKQNQGQLILGGLSSQFYTGDILYTPLQKEWYYEVILMNFSVGDIPWPEDCQRLNEDKTIVDSGTSDLRLPSHVFAWLVETLRVHANVTLPKDFWQNEKLLCLQGDPSSMFPPLAFTLYHQEQPFIINISPKLYLRPVIGGDESQTCYRIAISPSDKGTVLGAAILEGFYVVFDRENKRIGFANSSCSMNEIHPAGWMSSAPLYIGGAPNCRFGQMYDSKDSVLRITAYVLVAVCVICFIPLLVMLLHWIWHHLVFIRADSESNSLLEEYH